jgi:hypothetical protein
MKHLDKLENQIERGLYVAHPVNKQRGTWCPYPDRGE